MDSQKKTSDNNIRKDILRYSQLHAWFRYLTYEGKSYLLFPWKGEQPKNSIHPEVSDPVGIHWWVWDAHFIDELPIDGIGKDIIMRRPVTFNCFLRGLEGDVNNPVLKGWEVIKHNNPHLPKKIRHTKSSFDFARSEHNDQIEKAVKTAMEIYVLFKKDCPEWLEIPDASDISDASDDMSDVSSQEESLGSADIPRTPVRKLHKKPKVRRTQSDYLHYSPANIKLKETIYTKLSDKLSRKKNSA